MCAILLSAELVRATPVSVKCAIRHAAKVIYRHAHERTTEKKYFKIIAKQVIILILSSLLAYSMLCIS